MLLTAGKLAGNLLALLAQHREALIILFHLVADLPQVQILKEPPRNSRDICKALLNAVEHYYSLRFVDEFVSVTSKRRKGMGRRTDELCGVLHAILDGDEEAARDAMRHHLKSSQARYRALLRAGKAERP